MTAPALTTKGKLVLQTLLGGEAQGFLTWDATDAVWLRPQGRPGPTGLRLFIHPRVFDRLWAASYVELLGGPTGVDVVPRPAVPDPWHVRYLASRSVQRFRLTDTGRAALLRAAPTPRPTP